MRTCRHPIETILDNSVDLNIDTYYAVGEIIWTELQEQLLDHITARLIQAARDA